MRRPSSYREFDQRCVRADMREKYPLTRGYMTYNTVRRCAQVVGALVLLSIPWATSGVAKHSPGSGIGLGQTIKKVQENTQEVLGTVVLPPSIKQ